MDQSIVVRGAGKKTEQEILDLLSAFRGSDMSIKGFCQAQQISTASFHHWSKRFGNDGGIKNKRPGFSTLKIAASAVLFAEVGG
jgi:hypothetical protein